MKRLMISILPLILFLMGSPHEEIQNIKTNSIRITTNQWVDAPGLYLNEVGTIEAVNVFLKYGKLANVVDLGSSLITNTETIIKYKDRIITNTINIYDTSIDLFKLKLKQERKRTLIVDSICFAVGILGGVCIINDLEPIRYAGIALVGAGGIAMATHHIVIRFGRVKKRLL